VHVVVWIQVDAHIAVVAQVFNLVHPGIALHVADEFGWFGLFGWFGWFGWL